MRLGSTSGMTLLEIMVVIVIIGLIGSLVGVAVFERLGEASDRTARIQIGNIQQACDLFRLDNKKYPSGLSELANPPGRGSKRAYMAKIPKDPWGNDYQYRNPGSQNKGGVDIWSTGEDGVDGGSDDIGNWQLDEAEDEE